MENLLATETNSNQAIETTSNCTQNQVVNDLLCLLFGGSPSPSLRKNMMVAQEYVHDNVVPALENMLHRFAELYVEARPYLECMQQRLAELYVETKPSLESMQQRLEQFIIEIRPTLELIQQHFDSFNIKIEPILRTLIVWLSNTNINYNDRTKNENGFSDFIDETAPTETTDITDFQANSDRICYLQILERDFISFITGSIDITDFINEVTYGAFNGPWLIPLLCGVMTSIIMFAAIHDYRP